MKNAGLSEAEARRRFYAVDHDGLLVRRHGRTSSRTAAVSASRAAIANWQLERPDHISLLDVVRNAKPTLLIGVSGQAGTFTEEVVRAMAPHVERPVIFPLVESHLSLRGDAGGPGEVDGRSRA